MNEQIKLLAVEAGFYANPDIEKFEKFAELIINKMREVVWDNNEWCMDRPLITTEDMAIQIDVEICNMFNIE
jgi:hypothetical protein